VKHSGRNHIGLTKNLGHFFVGVSKFRWRIYPSTRELNNFLSKFFLEDEGVFIKLCIVAFLDVFSNFCKHDVGK